MRPMIVVALVCASACASTRSAFPSRAEVGQLAANHFATILPDGGWEERLREVGRRALWEGAQPIEIVERR